MNIDLKGDKLNWLKPVFRRRFTKEETVEVIVPDALPDVLRILDVDGTAYLRGKNCEAGRVTVSGVAELTVLYVPETGRGVKRVNADIPFTANAEGEGIGPDCLITAKLGISSCDARTVNPRKLVVRAEVAVEAALYTAETVYNTSPREREGIYFKTDSVRLNLPAAVNEKTFIFTDEAHLPASAPAIGELLRAAVSLSAESVKPVGSRAVIKGNAVTALLYESRDDGRLCRELITTPFSQIVETDAAGEVTDFELSLCLTGAHFSRGYMDDVGGETLNIEIHAVAQCVGYVMSPVESVTDVYSVKHPLTAAGGRLELEHMQGSDVVSETLKASVPVSGAVEDIHSVTVRRSSFGLREGPEGPVWTAVANLSVIYSEPGGELLSASKKIEFEKSAEEETEVDVTFGPDVFTTAGEASVEARIGVEITTVKRRRAGVERVESLELQEETPLDLSELPNVTVTRAGNRTLWELAKSHMSTESLIREANGIEASAEPESGCVLLIPRCG